VLILTLFLFLWSGCGDNHTEAERKLLRQCETWIVENHLTPVEYVTGLYDRCDVVILGEYHFIRHDQELVGDLIPALHDRGVNVLAIEFARAEDQPLIDSLLSAAEWNPCLARLIQFQYSPIWAAQGYLDIYHAAWSLNRSLTPDVEPFRILGVGCSPDLSYIKTSEDMQVDSLRRLVWGGCGEKDWAQVVLDQVNAGRKVLAYCGMHHAFSEYMHPIVDADGKFIRVEDSRFGRYLYDVLDKRVATVVLHLPWNDDSGFNGPLVRPVAGAIDEVMEEVTPGPVGFDVKNTPFGQLPAGNTVYRTGHANLKLADFCDGWIWQRPFSEYEVTPFIDTFINSSNIDEARRQAFDPFYRNATLEQYVLHLKRMFDREQRNLSEL